MKIIQISLERIDKEDYLDPGYPISTGLSYDYCWTLPPEEREKTLEELVSLFPEGKMRVGEDGTLVCMFEEGEASRFWLEKIRRACDAVTEENVAMASGPVQGIMSALENPLDTKELFSDDDDPLYWREGTSDMLMRMVTCMEKGDRLYVGTVLGYGAEPIPAQLQEDGPCLQPMT